MINIYTKNKLNKVSPVFYGIFFEDINYSGDGGLYAELIANRSFEYYDRDEKTDKHKMCWQALGNASFEIKSEKPINSVHNHYAVIKGEKGAGIKNIGFCKEGFSVKEGFSFSCYLRAENNIKISVKISDGSKVYGEAVIDVNSNEWKKYKSDINVNGTCKHAFLEITLEEAGEADIEFVSLFPKSAVMGCFRRDMVEMLEDIKPKFMRFPGGCIVEGRSFSNMYCWKDTIGSLEERKTNWNRWQMEEYSQEGRSSDDYFQSYGLGYFEYFLLCEYLGAKPVPVMNVGMTCQWHEGLLVDSDKLDKWIQDVCDLIEFANGGKDSEWGKKRIEMGHEAPFNLEYVGIGNEQWGLEYFERYEIFQREISKKYPDIKLITSAGWTDSGKEFDIAVEWMKENKEKAYAVDEHFYKSPEWFFENINRYDNYDRTMPKVFMGEYAAHTDIDVPKRRNNWKAALSEAAFLTGAEKNSDHVIMACYAPLFGRTNHQQWQPNLIWFDNDSIYGTPSYYVQKLFSNYIGEYIIKTQCEDKDLKISAGINKKELFVKIINTSGNDKRIGFNIDREIKSFEVERIEANLDDENSYENPKNVFPKIDALSQIDDCLIKGYSVNLFKMNI